MKTCSTCLETKPETDFYFDTHNNRYAAACKRCRVKKQVEYQRTENGKAKLRRARLKHRYGITAAQYDEMLARQGGACGICGVTTPGNGEREFFSVDHDHACCPGRVMCGGKCVRGLLCLRCNNSLGWMETYRTKTLDYLHEFAKRSGGTVLM